MEASPGGICRMWVSSDLARSHRDNNDIDMNGGGDDDVGNDDGHGTVAVDGGDDHQDGQDDKISHKVVNHEHAE
eukprot:6863899-Karenia_brevis.AAC.1